MKDLKITIGQGRNAVTIDELAENIYRSYQGRKIKGHSRDYHQFRIECSKQLQALNINQVKELSKTLLFEYDLRILGFDLIYYHKF